MYKLEETRVWRTYTGGLLIDKFNQKSNFVDSHYPEDWVASIVNATNPSEHSKENEGLSKIFGEEIFLKDLILKNIEETLGKGIIEKTENTTGVLMKILDSAERLTIQVHPTKEKAMELFNSNYGKTEAWHIIKTRETDEIKPYVLIGFNERSSEEKWNKAFYEQDIDALCSMLNKVYVNAGDTIIVNGGVPHAIGEGCLLFEIQEPTDLTLRVEKITPSGLLIEDSLIHQGIGETKMLTCFDHSKKCNNKQVPTLVVKDHSASLWEIIDYHRTECFSLYKLQVNGFSKLSKSDVFCVFVVIDGNGKISTESKEFYVTQGDRFFICATDKIVDVQGEDLEILIGFGPVDINITLL